MAQSLPTDPDWIPPLASTPQIRNLAREVAVRNGASVVLANAVADVTMLRLNDAAIRNPAVLCLLSGPNWRTHVAHAARKVLAGHRRAERDATSTTQNTTRPDSGNEHDELVAALLLEELCIQLAPAEQSFVHLRYFEGREIREIAALLQMSIERCREVGRNANRKIERALLDPTT